MKHFVTIACIDETKDTSFPRYLRLRIECLTCTGHQTVPEQQVLHGGRPIERSGVGIVDSEGQSVSHVIVKILADAWKVTDDRHTHRIELLPRPDAAVQENLRRVNGTCDKRSAERGLITRSSR